MQALVYRRYASPPALEVAELPTPTPAPDELLVAVKAAGLNQMDLKIAGGAFKLLTGSRFPKQLGADFSGEVVAVGADVVDHAAGDAVFGYVVDMRGKRGTFAQHLAVKAAKVARKPPSLSHTTAAALPCVYQTALQALRDAGRLQPGHRVLVYGASGGVGTAALQLARHLGAHVTAVSSRKNLDHCLRHGAHVALAHDDGPLWPRLTEPFDLIFQVFETRENLFRAARRHLAPTGRFIVSPNVGLLLRNLPAAFAGRFRLFAVKGDRDDLATIARLAVEGVAAPSVTVHDWTRYGAAFDGLQGFKGRGKTVLRIG